MNVRTMTPAIRVTLAAAYLLTWSSLIRFAVFDGAPWPVSMLSAGWAAIAFAILLGALVAAARQMTPTRTRQAS
jgi:hypothetical protein